MMIVMMSTLTGTWSTLASSSAASGEEVPTSTPGGFYGNALQAASYGSHEAVVRLLLENADVHAQGGHVGNAFLAASARGHDGVKGFSENKADAKAQGGEHSSALQAAPSYDVQSAYSCSRRAQRPQFKDDGM